MSEPEVVDFLRKWTTETKLQPEVKNKIAEWLGAEATGAKLADWDISRDAPYLGIEIPPTPQFPNVRGKYFYVWLEAPRSAIRQPQNYLTRAKQVRRSASST